MIQPTHYVADEEGGPISGAVFDLPSGGQIWAGECSNALFAEQPKETQDELERAYGTLVMCSRENGAPVEVVCRAASVEAGIEIAAALANSIEWKRA